MFASDADLQTNILKVLASGAAPMTPRAIAEALPVGGRPSTRGLQELLREMVREGRLARVDGAAERYAAARNADPAAVGAELQRLIDQLAARGLARERIRSEMLSHLGAAAGGGAGAREQEVRSRGKSVDDRPPNLPVVPPAAADDILGAMQRLEPRINEGAAVSIARLRDALSARLDKAAFDAAMLALLARGVVELQSHAWPARLTAEEKSLLVDNGRGGWFDSAALLRRPA